MDNYHLKLENGEIKAKVEKLQLEISVIKNEPKSGNDLARKVDLILEYARKDNMARYDGLRTLQEMEFIIFWKFWDRVIPEF